VSASRSRASAASNTTSSPSASRTTRSGVATSRTVAPGATVAAMRALVVTIIACLAGILVSPLTTLDPHESVVWLLPALALSAVSVAIATYMDSTVPTIACGLAWLVAVVAWLQDVPRALRGLSVDGLVTDRPAVQAAMLAVTAGAIAICFVRRDTDPNWRTLP